MNSVNQLTVRFFGKLSVGMNGISVAAQRIELDAAVFKQRREFLPAVRVVKQLGRLAVPVSRIAARADLDGLDANPCQILQRFAERQRIQRDGEHSDFHFSSPFLDR